MTLVAMENTGKNQRENIFVLSQINTALSVKIIGTQRRTKMICAVYVLQLAKCMPWNKATLYQTMKLSACSLIHC